MPVGTHMLIESEKPHSQKGPQERGQRPQGGSWAHTSSPTQLEFFLSFALCQRLSQHKAQHQECYMKSNRVTEGHTCEQPQRLRISKREWVPEERSDTPRGQLGGGSHIKPKKLCSLLKLHSANRLSKQTTAQHRRRHSRQQSTPVGGHRV